MKKYSFLLHNNYIIACISGIRDAPFFNLFVRKVEMSRVKYLSWAHLTLMISVATIFISCEKKISPMTVDTAINILLKDKSGNNLLDSTANGAYKLKDIRTYRLVDGKIIENNQPNLDAPKSVFLFKNTGNGEYVLRFFPYLGSGDPYQKGTRQELTTNYIKWKEGVTDTLVCTIVRINTSVYCDKIIYNGIEKYNEATYNLEYWGDGAYKRLIKIIK